jgi:hypothetical protein
LYHRVAERRHTPNGPASTRGRSQGDPRASLDIKLSQRLT